MHIYHISVQAITYMSKHKWPLKACIALRYDSYAYTNTQRIVIEKFTEFLTHGQTKWIWSAELLQAELEREICYQCSENCTCNVILQMHKFGSKTMSILASQTGNDVGISVW